MPNPALSDFPAALTRIWTIINQWFVTAGGVSFTPLTATATWNPASIADGDMEAKEVTVTGAAMGDLAIATFSVDVVDLTISATVTLADVVTVVLANNTGGAVDLASGTVRVVVFKVGANTLGG